MDLGNSYISTPTNSMVSGNSNVWKYILTWTAEVEVAVAPPGRKTFFCTFGAINLLKVNLKTSKNKMCLLTYLTPNQGEIYVERP